MTESKICTCPSGEGSLRWPCPAHPAVEQAVGDERAAFEAAFAAMGRPVCRADYDQDAYGTPFDDGGWTGWQARAALAQPSPAQAEAERPEVVAYFDRNYPSTGDAFIWSNYEGSPYEPVMTVAQHDRIAGELRAKAFQLREALEWRAENQAGQRELLRSVKAERDAALARVAELESATSYIEVRQCVNCRHIGINDAADYAACHDCRWTGPEPDEDKCPGCGSENCMAAACPECGGRYDLVAEASIATPVAQAQQLNDLDKQCRDDVARALGLRPNQERGFAWSYLLASIKSCVKAFGDSAQAQHSVPEDIMRDAQRYRWLRDQQFYFSFSTENSDAGISSCTAGMSSRFKNLSWVDAAIDSAIAAAPGKEVGHE
uniref:4Fe-4S ferredoxin-type domain-containing protein n=1 Tax=Pseudomonas aeruginosa TaxID=287 RepID=B3G1Q6_PSEAI|nr:hypothetical protein PACL_0728 [Pseudomonas aeruginosa]